MLQIIIIVIIITIVIAISITIDIIIVVVVVMYMNFFLVEPPAARCMRRVGPRARLAVCDRRSYHQAVFYSFGFFCALCFF
jgi:hypothetical protein